MLGDDKTVLRICAAHRGIFRAALAQAHDSVMDSDESPAAAEDEEQPPAAMVGVLGRPPIFQPLAPHDATEVCSGCSGYPAVRLRTAPQATEQSSASIIS